MRKKLSIIFCFAVFGAFAQGIRFADTTFAGLQALARQQKKHIFIDAYTTWCGPCKVIARTIFPDPEVGTFFDQHFISAEVDMEKGEGPALGEKYNVGCYPSFLFLDSTGKLVHRFSGMVDKMMFISFSYKTLLPDESFSALQSRYKNGDRDPALVREYIRACGFSCMSTNDVALDYLKSTHEKSLFEKDNWEIFLENVDDVHATPFTYFLNKRTQFVERYGEKQVDGKIFSAYRTAGYSLIFGGDTVHRHALERLRGEIDEVDFSRKDELRLTIDLALAEALSKWNDYYNTGRELIERYHGANYDFLNTVSYTLFEHSDNREHLAGALAWAKKSVDIFAEPANLDTYACLLWKNGRKSEALKVQKNAIAKAKANGEDTSQLEETLKKIGAGKG